MNLPILNSPIYTLELPSTGEDIEYRPFLVKEQKALMIAEQSKNQKNLNKTIIELINNCTFGKLNAESLPIFDVEIIFLKLRAKSVGETAEIIVTCQDDKKTKVPVKINIDEIDRGALDRTFPAPYSPGSVLPPPAGRGPSGHTPRAGNSAPARSQNRPHPWTSLGAAGWTLAGKGWKCSPRAPK